jgi:hypothetical protein
MKRKIITSICGAAAVLVVGAAGFSSVRADQMVPLNFQMPVHVSLNVNESGCLNSPGPNITLEGEIALGGLRLDLIFKNNLKGTHTDVVTFDTNVVLLALGSKITIPKQPVLGGVGGNPYIWLQFLDKDNNPLCDPALLGRCVQGLSLNSDFLNHVVGSTLISSAGCDNNPGPVITFGGGLNLSGLKARIIFTNNAKFTHVNIQYTDVDLISNGLPVTIPKQPVQGGAGGNPLIWLLLEQGDGDSIGDPIFLGRCNQL